MNLKCIMLYLFLDNFTNSVFSFKHKSPCNATEWRCDNCECINADDRCDGVYNCADKSDEIVDHCIHLPCPAYAFRCAYGACITGTNKCNGHRDCVDNSDETDFQCTTNLPELERTLEGHCGSPLLVQCKSGQCIKIDDRCDGVYDCDDHSDETVELCSYLYCPSYAFRCGYGGCIRGSAKCDGVPDCVDGSDEALDLCGYDRAHKKNATVLILHGPTIKHKDRVDGCLIPLHLKATDVQNVHSKEFLNLGTVVPTGSLVKLSCSKNHVLNGLEHNECVDKNWILPFPACLQYCPQHTILKGISTAVICMYNRQSVDCNSYLRENTTAIVRCAPGYRNADTKQMTLRCRNNLEWDYPKMKCEPKCGLLPNPNVSLSGMPWHVSIYENRINVLRLICGGTIISPKLIITAAKCFPAFDPIYYHIVLGNQQPILYQNQLHDKEVHNLSEILTPPNYSNEDENDLAIATLVDHFKFGESHTMPICLTEGWARFQPTMEYYRKSLNNDELARLDEFGIGFGLSTENTKRKRLRGIVSYIFRTDEKELLMINVDYYRDYIKSAIRKYKYIL